MFVVFAFLFHILGKIKVVLKEDELYKYKLNLQNVLRFFKNQINARLEISLYKKGIIYSG